MSVAARLDLRHTRRLLARRRSARHDPRNGGLVYQFLHPLHAELLRSRAQVFQQRRVAEHLRRSAQQSARAGMPP